MQKSTLSEQIPELWRQIREMVSKYCIMPAYNAIRKNIYNLYGSESQGNPDKTSEQNWDGTESSRLLQRQVRICPGVAPMLEKYQTDEYGHSWIQQRSYE